MDFGVGAVETLFLENLRRTVVGGGIVYNNDFFVNTGKTNSSDPVDDLADGFFFVEDGNDDGEFFG